MAAETGEKESIPYTRAPLIYCTKYSIEQLKRVRAATADEEISESLVSRHQSVWHVRMVRRVLAGEKCKRGHGKVASRRSNTAVDLLRL